MQMKGESWQVWSRFCIDFPRAKCLGKHPEVQLLARMPKTTPLCLLSPSIWTSEVGKPRKAGFVDIIAEIPKYIQYTFWQYICVYIYIYYYHYHYYNYNIDNTYIQNQKYRGKGLMNIHCCWKEALLKCTSPWQAKDFTRRSWLRSSSSNWGFKSCTLGSSIIPRNNCSHQKQLIVPSLNRSLMRLGQSNSWTHRSSTTWMMRLAWVVEITARCNEAYLYGILPWPCNSQTESVFVEAGGYSAVAPNVSLKPQADALDEVLRAAPRTFHRNLPIAHQSPQWQHDTKGPSKRWPSRTGNCGRPGTRTTRTRMLNVSWVFVDAFVGTWATKGDGQCSFCLVWIQEAWRLLTWNLL